MSALNQIPKICHLFWDGFPMSFYHVFTVLTFKKHNPDWEIIVWRSKQNHTELGKNSFVSTYTGKDHFDVVALLPYVQIKEVDLVEWGINTDIPACSSSDIFRMKVLHKFGGVYSDFDVLWVKPISELCNVDCIGDLETFECTVCFYQNTFDFQNVSIMIAAPGATYLMALIQAQEKVQPPYQHQSYGSSLVTEIFPTLIGVWAQGHHVLALPYETFYPYTIFNLGQLFETDNLSMLNKNVLAVHWFCGHEISLSFLNAQDTQDKKKRNSFTHIIQEFLENA